MGGFFKRELGLKNSDVPRLELSAFVLAHWAGISMLLTRRGLW